MESKDKEFKNKKNVSQNSFDFSSIMGYPPMGQLSNPFPMLGPNPMFPFFPFPGMTSPGDNILPSDGADWWKMASEQAKKFAENMSELYPGMSSMYGGNPFLSPFAQSAGSRISSTPSPSVSHHKSLHSTPDGLFNGTKQSSNNSSPAPAKDSGGTHFKGCQKESRAGSARSTRTRTDSESSTVISPRNPSESSTPVKQPFISHDQVLKKSSLSGDQSLYASNPYFFPFGPLGFPGMSFPAASMFGSINDYVPPFNNLFLGSSGIKPSGSGLDNQRLSSSSSSKNSSRASQGLYQSGSDFPGTSYFGGKHKNDSSDLGRREGSSAIVSKHGFSMPGTAARTLSINDHKLQLGAFKSRQDLADKNRKLKNMMKNSSDFKAMTMESSSPLSSNYFQSESPLMRTFNKLSDKRESSCETVSYSQDGAIDLSVKKPRMESPGPMNPLKSYPSIRQNQPEASNILSALAQSHQMFSKSSSSFSDPLSFNMAAALLPHMFENMFYPSSFAGDTCLSKDVDKKGGGRRGRKRGEQGGKGRGGRSMFISSMMANDTLKDLSPSLADATFKQGGSSARPYLDRFMMDHRQNPKASQTVSSFPEFSAKDQKSTDGQSSVFQDFFNFDLSSSSRHNDLSSDTESSDDASDDWSFADPHKNQDSRKRKRESPDEKLLRIPLEQGWQRETRITGVTSKKMIGQVAYETPTGLRVLTFDDVEKFLLSTQNTELTRRNFSFNANINLGKFFEQRTNEKGQSDLISLNEREVADKFTTFEVQRKRSTEKKRMKLACQQMMMQRQQQFRDFQMEDGGDKKMDQQADEASKVRDALKKPPMTQQQQQQMKLQQHRDTTTTKMQTLLDEKDRKQQLFAKDQQNMMMMFGSGDLQYYSYLLQSSHKHDSSPLDPHKQGFGLERERRRHYMLLVKAIDARKKEEEKERMREEKRCAKKLDREKKMEQRRMELYLARELKKPMEDRLLQDSKPLPDLGRIRGLKLPGKSFADCLMVLEFAHNFSPNLKLENDALPTLSMLQDGLMNESSSESFTKFIIHVLKLAFDDPGFPNSREAVILSGQKISDVEVTRQNFSELLRVFIRARNGKEDEMAEWLRTKPFHALNPSQKTTILLYICHELLTSKAITNEVEKSIDLISNLKKDKWVIEGKLRKFRMMQAKRLRRSLVVRSQTNEDSNTTTLTSDNNKNNNNTDDDQSVADSTDEALQNHDSEVEEDQLISPEELESKVEKLTKQYNNLQDKVLSLSYKLSIVPLGQDRYRRLYWVLPKCGGVYVEGMESGEPEDADLTTDPSDVSPELTPPILEPLNNNDHHSTKPSNASNPPTPISCCSKLNEPSDIPDCKPPRPPSDVKLQPADSSKTNGSTAEKISADPKPVKNYESVADMTESTITNLEDIITRTVMNSMMEDEVNSPYDLPSLEKFEPKKFNEVDLISKFLASSDNEDDRQGVALSPSMTKGDFFRREKIFPPSRQLLPHRKEEGQIARTEVRDELEMLKKKLAYSVDRGSWFSLFARSSGCVPPSSSRPSSLMKEAYGQDSRALLDRSISSTPTANSRSSTPINPRTNYDDDPSYADWESKVDEAGDKQDPPPVPLDKQRGWWRISDPEQLKSTISCLNVRGVRERNLHKLLDKNFNFICQSSLKTKRNIMKLEAADDDFVENFTRAPRPDQPDLWDFGTHRTIEMEVLGDIGNLEEKVCNASLQGWRMSPRSSQDIPESLVGSFEKDLKANDKYIMDVARDKLLHLEHNIERRYLKPPLGRSNHLNLASLNSQKHSEEDDSDGDDEAATKELLLWRSAVTTATSTSQLSLYLSQLNKCIAWEKSIMKVSCQICCCDDNEAELLLCDMCDRGYHTYCIKPKLQSIPEGDWFCYECISKASGDTCCIACGRHGGRLVVCDSCKRRAHSSCLDPPLNRVPKKWCCNPCLSDKLRPKKKHSNNKIGFSPSLSSLSPASSSSSSAPCAQTSSLVGREFVEPVHGELNGDRPPPLNEVVEKTNQPSVDHQSQHQPSLPPPPPPPPPPVEPPQPRCEKLKIDLKKRLQQEKALRSSNAEQGQVKSSNNVDHNQVTNGTNSLETDLTICHTVLSEMKKHQDAWPFLTPVSSKQFPTYRKVIRCPIDFQTISKRLKISFYKTREEFACDARLVFNNCEMFNEDDSTVGRAGHSMQDFFERRWIELTNS